MSQPAVKWGQLKRFLLRNKFKINISSPDGDKVIRKDGIPHRIGHTFCNHTGDELSRGHLTAIKRKYGVTRSDILNS